MGTCHFGEHCPVMEGQFARLPGIADLFKERYCEGDYSQCARHRLADLIGVGKVPDRLLPNDHEEAARLAPGYIDPA